MYAILNAFLSEARNVLSLLKCELLYIFFVTIRIFYQEIIIQLSDLLNTQTREFIVRFKCNYYIQFWQKAIIRKLFIDM